MNNQPSLSGSRDLQILSRDYSGSISWIHNIPTNGNPERVLGLISGQQLVTSSNGKQIAYLVRAGNGFERVAHNLVGVPSVLLAGEAGARILKVTSKELVVFGSPDGTDVVGVYEITKNGRRLLLATSEVVSQNSLGPLIVVCSADDVDEKQVLSKRFSFAVANETKIVFLSDGSVLILEQIGRDYYRYVVSHDGLIKDMSRIPKAQGATPFALVKWLNRYFLATKNESKLIRLSPEDSLVKKEIALHGNLESFWQSPNQKSIAWLVSDPELGKDFKKLYVNGFLVYEGEFTVKKNDFVWSPNGVMFGALVRIPIPDSDEQQFIITPIVEREITQGQSVKEFLVDNKGQIAATIIQSGRFYHPNVYVRPHDSVPVAWNLSWAVDGGIAYNSALTTKESVVLMRTADETHLLR